MILGGLLVVGEARAEGRPRDVFLDPPPSGNFALFDVYTVGVQANVEKRIGIRSDDYAMITPRVGALASLGFGELGGHLDARFFFLSAGASAGVRRVWRTYAFGEGQVGTREERLAMDEDKTYGSRDFGFGELRTRLALPLTEQVFGLFAALVRYDASPYNAFDWSVTTMRDGGWMARVDATLFFRSKEWGAIGPTVRGLEFKRKGRDVTELAVGFTAGRTVGLLPNDLVLLNVLTRPGDDEFGFHTLRSPLFTLLVYRVGLSF